MRLRAIGKYPVMSIAEARETAREVAGGDREPDPTG
jgi:hypothetical protein